MAIAEVATRLYTTPTAARILGVSTGYLRDLIAGGHVRSVRPWPGSCHRIPEDELERLLGRPLTADDDDEEDAAA